MTDYIKDPEMIEAMSFQIIESLLPDLYFPPEQKAVVYRMVHTSGDPDIARDVVFSPEAISAGLQAIEQARPILVDTTMALAGLDKSRLTRYGCYSCCTLNLPGVAEGARSKGTTRSMAAIDLLGKETDGSIIAIGNAPTALFRLIERVRQNELRPGLIIGLAVGFVGAAESKEELLKLNLPHITLRGTRGGSTLAAACINGLLRLAERGITNGA